MKKQKLIVKKHRFKAGNATLKAIEALAKILPAMVHTDKATGAVIYETFTDRTIGDRIPKADRRNIPNWDPNAFYNVVKKRHALVNHVVVMKDIYEHDGDKGIEDYLNIIQGHLNHEQLMLNNLKEETYWQKFVRFVKG